MMRPLQQQLQEHQPHRFQQLQYQNQAMQANVQPQYQEQQIHFQPQISSYSPISPYKQSQSPYTNKSNKAEALHSNKNQSQSGLRVRPVTAIKRTLTQGNMIKCRTTSIQTNFADDINQLYDSNAFLVMKQKIIERPQSSTYLQVKAFNQQAPKNNPKFQAQQHQTLQQQKNSNYLKKQITLQSQQKQSDAQTSLVQNIDVTHLQNTVLNKNEGGNEKITLGQQINAQTSQITEDIAEVSEEPISKPSSPRQQQKVVIFSSRSNSMNVSRTKDQREIYLKNKQEKGGESLNVINSPSFQRKFTLKVELGGSKKSISSDMGASTDRGRLSVFENLKSPTADEIFMKNDVYQQHFSGEDTTQQQIEPYNSQAVVSSYYPSNKYSSNNNQAIKHKHTVNMQQQDLLGQNMANIEHNLQNQSKNIRRIVIQPNQGNSKFSNKYSKTVVNSIGVKGRPQSAFQLLGSQNKTSNIHSNTNKIQQQQHHSNNLPIGFQTYIQTVVATNQATTPQQQEFYNNLLMQSRNQGQEMGLQQFLPREKLSQIGNNSILTGSQTNHTHKHERTTMIGYNDNMSLKNLLSSPYSNQNGSRTQTYSQSHLLNGQKHTQSDKLFQRKQSIKKQIRNLHNIPKTQTQSHTPLNHELSISSKIESYKLSVTPSEKLSLMIKKKNDEMLSQQQTYNGSYGVSNTDMQNALNSSSGRNNMKNHQQQLTSQKQLMFIKRQIHLRQNLQVEKNRTQQDSNKTKKDAVFNKMLEILKIIESNHQETENQQEKFTVNNCQDIDKDEKQFNLEIQSPKNGGIFQTLNSTGNQNQEILNHIYELIEMYQNNQHNRHWDRNQKFYKQENLRDKSYLPDFWRSVLSSQRPLDDKNICFYSFENHSQLYEDIANIILNFSGILKSQLVDDNTKDNLMEILQKIIIQQRNKDIQQKVEIKEDKLYSVEQNQLHQQQAKQQQFRMI
eukprot:403376958